MKHPLSEHPPGSLMHLIQCYFDRKPDLDLPCHIVPNEMGPEDLAIADRLLTAFHKAHRDELSFGEDRPTDGVWEVIKNESHGPAYQVLLNHDVHGLARLLSNALGTSWAQGIGMRVRRPEDLVETSEAKDTYVLYLKDRLVSLAVAVGVLPPDNPELGPYGHNVHLPIDYLVDLIEDEVGLELSRPAIMGVMGLLAKGGKIIDVRLPEDVYAVYRIGKMAGVRHVAEIGGGFGGTAHRIIIAGLQASVFDLPVINVLQGYYLIKSIGFSKVKLYGEDIADRNANILPWWSIYDRSRSFDLVYNRDSLPEIPERNVKGYLKEVLARQVPLLSINQESEALTGHEGVKHISVAKIAADVGLQRHSRFPYWIRCGYVEEVYGGSSARSQRFDQAN